MDKFEGIEKEAGTEQEKSRRDFLLGMFGAVGLIVGGASLTGCIRGPVGRARRVRRRVRRRTRRRIRRRMIYRNVSGRRMLVVPRTVVVNDQIQLPDGSWVTVVAVQSDRIIILSNGAQKEVMTVFEGS